MTTIESKRKTSGKSPMGGMVTGTVAIGVVAHHKRLTQAWDLAAKVEASYLSVDRGQWGPRRNHAKVWEQLAQDYINNRSYTEWSLVLEDDAQPCEGFREQLNLALSAAPSDIVSLYLGTGYPTAWQDFIKHIQRDESHWAQTHTLLHAVGVVVKTELIGDMWEWITHYDDSMLQSRVADMPIDAAITEWARAHAHVVSYTRPSLVDHHDGPTLINHPDAAGDRSDKARRAWQFGTRDAWKSSIVLIP